MQISSPSHFTPLSAAVTEAQYELVVRETLSRAPSTIRSKFERSRDPRLLFPYALDASRKKVLSDWLDAHYFIPKDMLTPVPASKLTVGSGPQACNSVASLENDRSAPEAASMPYEIVDPNVPTLNIQTQTLAPQMASSTVTSITKSLSSFTISAVEHDVPMPSLMKLPVDADERTAVSPLLEISSQKAAYDFDTFMSGYPTENIPHHSDGRRMSSDIKNLTWRKIGEASFSEVFRVGEVVLKIVPLEYRDPNSTSVNQSDHIAIDQRGRARPKPRPSTSLPQDVLREINATRIMGDVHSGFTGLLWYRSALYSLRDPALTERVHLAPMSSRDDILLN